jgi:hypothetical protein
MSNKFFPDDLPPPSAEATEAVKQITDLITAKLYQKLDAIDDSVSDEEIEAFVRDLAKVAEDNKDKINYIPALEE